MSWEIRIPFRSRDDPLAEVGFDSRHLDPEDAAITRQLVVDAMLGSDCQTVGDLLDMVERANPAERREILNRARTGAGLDTVEGAAAHAKFVAANRALRPRPLPTCPACGTTPTTSAGFPDPQAAAGVRRWWCEAHRDHAPPGDLASPPSGVDLSMRALPDPDELEHERRRDAKPAERARERFAERRLRALEAEAVARARAEQDRRELFGGAS